MFKLIFLVLGLAIGFGGGVYWAHKNPEQAAKLSAEEEKRFLEAQLRITQTIQAKLDQLQSKTASSSSKSPGAGFVGSAQSAGPTAAEVKDVKAETEKQEQELQKRLAELK